MSRDLFLAGGGNTTKMYDLPLEKFEQTYIEKATDVRELEKIVKVLRSGTEGSFPHLEDAAEKRLREIDPESRTLRKSAAVPRKSDLPADTQDKLSSDITEFLDDISNVDQQLRKRPASNCQQRKDEVPVRGVAVKINKENVESSKSPKPRDYREWERLEKTLDTELEKEPIDEKPGTQRHADTATEVDVSGKSEVEKNRLAEMDKEKGNEYFNAGDYDLAIIYYTRSLSIIPSPASYNNRALVYLKRENYSRCIADCQAVLEVEPNNVKALLRRGSSYKAQCEYTKAKRDFNRVLELEPQNLRANKLLKETENAWRTKGKKLKIDEVEGDDEANVDVPKVNGASDMVANDNQPVVNGTVNGVTESESRSDESAKPKPRRIVIEESESEEEGEGEGEGEVLQGVSDAGMREEKVKVKANNKHVTQDDEMSSDAASVKTASTDISSDSDLATTSTDTSPLHQAFIPQRPILTTVPLPENLAALKETANTAFRSGQFALAREQYTRIIDELSQRPEHVVNLSTLFTNRAAAYFKMGDCKAAIQDCDKSLKCVPHGVKALLKRAQAYETAEKYKEAYRDFKHVLAVDTTLQDHVQQGMNRCRGMLFAEYGKEWRSKVKEVIVNSYEIPLIVPESGMAAMNLPTSQTNEEKLVENKIITPEASRDLSEPPPLEEAPVVSPATVEPTHVTTSKPEPKISKPVDPVLPKEKPTLIKESEHETLKTKGNRHVGKNQFREAIQCYTKCLEIFQDRSAVYTNRALCYLKLDEPSNAVADCDKAIALDDGNVKAWFRRAQGRKMQNDYRNCMSDLLQVLRIDSTNGAAKKELEIVKTAYHDTFAKEQKARKEEDAKKEKGVKKKETTGKKKKPIIEVVSETKTTEDLKPQSQEKYEKPKVKQQSKSKPQQQQQQQQQQKTETKSGDEPKPMNKKVSQSRSSQQTETKTDETKPKAKKEPQSKKTKKAAKLPQEPAPEPVRLAPAGPVLQNKESPYEFMQAWASLKGNQDFSGYASLLDQIQPRHLSKLLGNKLDHEILTTILRTIQEHTLESDLAKSYHLLHHLRQVERFDMATMFMSNLDKVIVKEALTKMASDVRCPGSKMDLTNLTKAYKV